MPDTLEKKQIPPISQEDWLEHFKNLHDVPAKIKNPEQQDIKRESENMEKNQIESSDNATSNLKLRNTFKK